MKKLFLSLLLIIFILPITVFAEEKVEIKSIELLSKSDNAEIVEEATTDGEKINFNIIFYDKGDFVSYKLLVSNPTDTGLYVNDKYFNYDNKYVKYNFEYQDDSNFVKAGEEKLITLNIKYDESVPNNLFSSAKYDASINKPLILSNTLLKIPNTLKNMGILGIVFMILIIACIILGIILLIKKNKNSGINVLLIAFMMLLMPNAVNALLSVEIPIDSKVLIKKIKPNPCTYEGELVNYARYVNGQYTYNYQAEKGGWSVYLTDKNSTDPVTTKLCTTVNGKPIVSFSATFSTSKTTSIDLSSFDTSNADSFDYMFNNLPNITSLDVSTFDTSKAKYISSMFKDCPNLEKIDLSSFDLGEAYNIYYMFENDMNLHEIVTPKNYSDINYKIQLPLLYKDDDNNYYLNIDSNSPKKKRLVYADDVSMLDVGSTVNSKMRSVASGGLYRIERAYEIPEGLVLDETNNVISSAASSVKTYAWGSEGTVYYYSLADDILMNPNSGSLFQEYSNVTYIDLKHMKSDLVTNFGTAFYKCAQSSTSIVLDGIEDLNTSNVTNFFHTFMYFGGSVTNFEIDLSKWDMSNVTDLSSIFEGALSNAQTLKIDIHGWKLKKLTDIMYAFSKVGRYSKKIDFNMKDIEFDLCTTVADWLSYGGQNSEEAKVDVSGWKMPKMRSLYNFFYYAFQRATTVDIIGIENWNVSSVTNLNNFLYGVGENLKNVELDLSSWDVSNCTGFNSTFYGFGRNADKAVITLHNWKIKSEASLGYMFMYAGMYAKEFTIDLEGWEISSNVSFKNFNTYNAQNTKDLKLILKNWDTTEMTSMEFMFSTLATNASKANIDLTGWNTSNVTNMSGTFCGSFSRYTDLTIVGFDNLDTSNVKNMRMIFSNTKNMTLNDFKVYVTGSIEEMFDAASYMKGTVTFYTDPYTISRALRNLNQYSGSDYTITINYTSEVTKIDDIMNTLLNGNNVVKGELIEP